MARTRIEIEEELEALRNNSILVGVILILTLN